MEADGPRIIFVSLTNMKQKATLPHPAASLCPIRTGPQIIALLSLWTALLLGAGPRTKLNGLDVLTMDRALRLTSPLFRHILVPNIFAALITLPAMANARAAPLSSMSYVLPIRPHYPHVSLAATLLSFTCVMVPRT